MKLRDTPRLQPGERRDPLALSFDSGELATEARWVPAFAGTTAYCVKQSDIARPSRALAIISPPILTALRRNARQRLSTCSSTDHPHAVWTTSDPKGHDVVKISPHILTGLRHKAAVRLSTRFPNADPHGVWTSGIVEHAAAPCRRDVSRDCKLNLFVTWARCGALRNALNESPSGRGRDSRRAYRVKQYGLRSANSPTTPCGHRGTA